MKRTLATLILLLPCILPVAAQSAAGGHGPTVEDAVAAIGAVEGSIRTDRTLTEFVTLPERSIERTFGLGRWYSHGTPGDADGVAVSYTHDRFHVGIGYDTRGGRLGFILAGPGLPVPTLRFGPRASMRLPLHAVCGVTDFADGRFDWGAVAGIQIRTARLAFGIQAQYTRHTAALGAQIGF